MSRSLRTNAIIIVIAMTFMTGCSCKSAQFRPMDAVIPDKQQLPCNTIEITNSYYSIQEEFISFNPPKQNFFGKLVQKCHRDLLITMHISLQYSLAGIHSPAITLSVPIYYLSFNESTSEFKEESLKGNIILPKYGLKENDVLRVSFQMTETQKMDSGEIISILSDANNMTTILLMPQVSSTIETINAITKRIDTIINRNYEFSQNISGGLTLTPENICNYSNIAIVNKSDAQALRSDWHALPTTQEQCLARQCLRKYDYIMLSINHSGPFIHDIASLRDSSAWAQVSSTYLAELKSRKPSYNWTEYFESTITPYINALHIARKDSSLIKAFLLYQSGVSIDESTPQTIISQEEIEYANKAGIYFINPKLRIAKEFIEAWRVKSNSFNDSTTNIYLTGDGIQSRSIPTTSFFEEMSIDSAMDTDSIEFQTTSQGKVKFKARIQNNVSNNHPDKNVRITLSFNNNALTGVNISEIH